MMPWRPILFLTLTGLLWPFQSAQLFGQTSLGVVTDESKGALPGATVTPTNINTGISRMVLTDEAGRCAVLSLPAALYRLQAESAGFTPAVPERITPEVAQTLDIDFAMKVAGVEEKIGVTAEALLANKDTAELGGGLAPKRLVELPISSRDFARFSLLTPGAVTTARGILQVTFNGQQTTHNSYTMDGIDASMVFLPSPRQNIGVTGNGTVPSQALRQRVLNTSSALAPLLGTVPLDTSPTSNPNVDQYPTVRPFFILPTLGQASEQSGAARFEYFIGTGADYVNLGRQSALLPSSEGFLSLPDTSFVLTKHSAVSWFFFTGLRYRFRPQDAVEVSYRGSMPLFPARGTTTGAAFTTSYETHTLSFNYVRYLPERGRLRPFATVGLGVTASVSWAGWDRHNVTGNFGLGTDIRLNRRLAVRVEARDFVARPDELHGMVHSVHASTSLVVALEDAPPTRETFPRVEFVTETGASFLTRGSGPSESVSVLLPNGQTQNAVLTRGTSFSKAGRVVVGFRFRVTEKNALEFDWSYSPNRYELTGSLDLPGYGDVVPDQLTQALNTGALNYVRYLPRPGKWQPFVTAGLGFARFSGLDLDSNRWGGNFGAGVDVPVRSRVALRFEVRDFVFGQPEPVHGITHNLTPAVGLAFQFY